MLFCTGSNNGVFSVLDTSDGIEEQVNIDELRSYLSAGVEILGVSLDSLTLNDTTIVLVDFPSRVYRCGSVFNGYFFQEYTEETYQDFHNPYLYSVIKLDKEDVYKLLEIIQQVNISIFNKLTQRLSTCKEYYKVTALFDNGFLNILDHKDGNEYGFSYSDICYSLYVEGYLVEGCTCITPEYAIVDNQTFPLFASLGKNYEDAVVKAEISATVVENRFGKQLTSAYATSSSLVDFLAEYDGCYLTEICFPMVNLFDYATQEGFQYEDVFISVVLDSIKAISSENYISKQGNSFVFDITTVDYNIASMIYQMFKTSKPEFYNDVVATIARNKAKTKLLTGKEVEDDGVAFRINQDYYKSKGRYEDSGYSLITQVPKYFSIETKFGGIFTSTAIKSVDFEHDLDSFGGLFIFRLSSTAGYYYRVDRGGITIFLSRNNMRKQAKHIENGSVNKYFDGMRDELGYYYTRPNIIPLFIHSVVEEEDGVQINVVVAMNTNRYKSFLPTENKKVDTYHGWGKTFLVVPLLVTGARHRIEGDFVVFNFLFQDVLISKELYRNLVMNIDENNDLLYTDNCAEASSADKCNCETGFTSVNASAFRGTIRGEIRYFNSNIDKSDYFE